MITYFFVLWGRTLIYKYKLLHLKYLQIISYQIKKFIYLQILALSPNIIYTIFINIRIYICMQMRGDKAMGDIPESQATWPIASRPFG